MARRLRAFWLAHQQPDDHNTLKERICADMLADIKSYIVLQAASKIDLFVCQGCVQADASMVDIIIIFTDTTYNKYQISVTCDNDLKFAKVLSTSTSSKGASMDSGCSHHQMTRKLVNIQNMTNTCNFPGIKSKPSHLCDLEFASS